MRVALLNTGTELLLGDVQDAHLAFIAREILVLGLRVQERRTVPDGPAIHKSLVDLFPRAEILFVTGGLGPTSDDITRDIVADLLGLELQTNADLLTSLRRRLRIRGIKWSESIARQAQVPAGAEILPNDNGSASGLFLKANISPQISSPHLFILPGPPRELQPMFRKSVIPMLRSIIPSKSIERRLYKIAGMGESTVEEAIGEKVLAISGVELGYCARPGEVDVRIVGQPDSIARADEIIRGELDSSIFSTNDQELESVLVKLLAEQKATVAVAESCTGGLLAHRLTNVPGASNVFLAGYVTYSNDAKIDILDVDRRLLEKHGAVSEQVAAAMAQGARLRAKSTYALSTTGIAGPDGGSDEKPVGTVYLALATPNEMVTRKLFFPTDRETFKDLAVQNALDLLRRKLL
ncbi:MAG TPA: competence/damage-inducible protein A [Chthoniobacterales bacterium]|nr:competence/damage-inducible protein A [Chthoniobacterales bacterium]